MAKKKYYKSPMMDNNAMDPRRRFQMEDSQLLHEDPRAIANLPQDVKYHAWSRADDYRHYDLNDTVQSVDNQMKVDSKLGKKGPFPEKY